MYERILVPIDGSELAERALTEAEQLARLTGAQLLLVRVVSFPNVSAAGLGAWEMQQSALAQLVEQDTAEATSYLDEVQRRISAEGLAVKSEVRRGLVVPGILDGTRPGDLIVMSTHGRGGIKRWFLGSVAEDIVRQSAVPVLLVRTGGTVVA